MRRGFIHRHNICYRGYYYAINPHQTRHTIATQIYLGGGGFGTVTEHLHHRSPIMTGVYVHGSERDVSELRKALDEQHVVGKVTPLIIDREVFIGDISDVDLEYYRESGMYIQPTPYGFCTRPVKRGPCPHPHPCWRGPKGDPCEVALILPRGVEAIEEDISLIRLQAENWEKNDPQSPFLSNVRATMTYYERLRAMMSNEETQASVTKEMAASSENVGTSDEKPILTLTPQMRKNRRQGKPYLPTKKNQEKIIDGMTTSQRVNSVYNELKVANVSVTVREF